MDAHWINFSRSGAYAIRPQRWTLHRLIGEVERRVVTPQDDSDSRDNKTMVAIASLAVCVCGLLWGSLYLIIGSFYASIFPFFMVVLSILGLMNLVKTRNITVIRSILCFGLCFNVFAVHWSLGGRSGEVITWALLAPQLVIFAGDRLRMGWYLMAVVAVALLVSFCLETFIDFTALIPRAFLLNQSWLLFFHIVNTIFPWLISLMLTWFILLRLRTQKRALEQDLIRAERMAQHIIDFDLDPVCMDVDPGNRLVLALLQQVAMNLQQYRPYLPAHLLDNPKSIIQEPLMSAGQQNEVAAMPHSLPPGSPAATPLLRPQVMPPSAAVHGQSSVSFAHEAPREEVLSSTTSNSGEEESFPSKPSSRVKAISGTLRAPIAAFDVPQIRRLGTLLYVRLHDLETQAMELLSIDQVSEVSNFFAEIVMGALKETQGVVHSIHPNACLASWNFITGCRTHAENACYAANKILRSLQGSEDHAELPPLKCSMGLWAGQMISGTFGTQHTKASGLLGFGLERVQQLQMYAVTTHRTAIANTEFYQNALASQKFKFLPVDIVATNACNSLDEVVSMSCANEVVYEMLGELSIYDSEWMLQMDESAHPERQLEKLLQEVKNGIPNLPAFRQQLKNMVAITDPLISDVAMQFHRLLREGKLRAGQPYQRCLVNLWCPPGMSSLHVG